MKIWLELFKIVEGIDEIWCCMSIPLGKYLGFLIWLLLC